MASLKEVKTRIASVNSTRKITSAMKMVASSKLHRAQQAIERMRPYERQLSRIMSTFVGSMENDVPTPYAAQREVKRVAILLFTSNTSLCGAFNSNVVKAFAQLDHPSYDAASSIAAEVMKLFEEGEIDHADLIYHHFKSAGSQLLTTETFLPVDIHASSSSETTASAKDKRGKIALDFIVEPSKEEVVEKLTRLVSRPSPLNCSILWVVR